MTIYVINWFEMLLKIQKRSGEWIWAPPIPDTFVCNIGDMIEVFADP